jgi:hypothetical protein
MWSRRLLASLCVLAASLSSFGVALGQDKTATADAYLKFVRPYFPGIWRIEAVGSDGSAKAMGTMEFRLDPRQRSAVSIGTGEEAAAVSYGIHGYDPATKSWRVLQFLGDGSMVTMEVNIPKEVLTAGKYENLTYTHRNTVTSPDGTQKVSQWKATIVDHNTLVFEQVSGDSSLPPKSRFVRQSSAASTK